MDDEKVKAAAAEQDKRRADHDPDFEAFPKMIYPDDELDPEKGVIVADELAEKAQRSVWANPDNASAIRAEESKRRADGEITRLDKDAEAEAKAAQEADDAKREEYKGLETSRIAGEQQRLKDAGVDDPSKAAEPPATARPVEQVKAEQPGRAEHEKAAELPKLQPAAPGKPLGRPPKAK